jgi:mycothiol synthase
VPWDERLVDIHGDVKYRCFVDELDTAIFPNLGSATGCRLLMRAIRDCLGFCPCATWLVAGPDGYCGTVQGVLHETGVGVIQNLLAQAVAGFAISGARTVALDVTAANTAAVRLYRKFGFRATKTTYLATAGV